MPDSASCQSSRSANEWNDRVNVTGDKTTRVPAAITDLEINEPTESQLIHRNRVFVASSGQITLAVDIYDSRTGELVVRIQDRRQARDDWHGATTVSE